MCRSAQKLVTCSAVTSERTRQCLLLKHMMMQYQVNNLRLSLPLHGLQDNSLYLNQLKMFSHKFLESARGQRIFYSISEIESTTQIKQSVNKVWCYRLCSRLVTSQVKNFFAWLLQKEMRRVDKKATYLPSSPVVSLVLIIICFHCSFL